jgi:parvulin-like peptidyl-prolyl isomerase
MRSFALMTLAFLAPISAGAAPGFILDGRFDELEALKLAEGPNGPISALELLFFLDLARDPVAHIPVEVWLAEPDERDPKAWRFIADQTKVYLAVLTLAANAAPAEMPGFLRRSSLYSAAHATWIDTTVRPEIVINEVDINRYYIAHAEKYSKPDSAQVRYIHLGVPDLAEIAVQREAEEKLQEIRGRIAARELTFEEAARQYSDAPSKTRGGLIPEFERGTHFPEFEYQVFSLKQPGDMSPAFSGNQGVYLLQLVSRHEAERFPIDSVREEIRQTLSHEHIRSYFRLMLAKLGQESFSANYSALWDYAALTTPVAIFRDTPLTRDQVIKINPNVVNAAYAVNWSVIFDETERWIQGEYVLRDLEKRGLASGKYFDLAERAANTRAAAFAELDRRIDLSRIATREGALEFLGGEEGGIPQSRIIAISLIPDDEAFADITRRDAVRDTMRQLSNIVVRGRLPTRPNEMEFSRAIAEAASEGDEALETIIDDMQRAVRGSPWAGVTVRVADLGWKDSLVGLAWHSSIAGLRRGQLSAMQPIGDSQNFYYSAAIRIQKDSPWLESPLALRAAAYELLLLEQIGLEMQKTDSQFKLLFEVPAETE